MDYVNVGANGIAQVADLNYREKNKVELEFLMKLLQKEFPIPAELKGLCWFAKKAFLHDFGTYHEIIVWYDDMQIIEDEEENESEIFCTPEEFWQRVDDVTITPVYKLPTLYETFWDWFNKVEMCDLESDEITEQIKALYYEMLDKDKGEHPEIVRA